MIVVILVGVILLALSIVCKIFIFEKNEATFRNHGIIIDAILEYSYDREENNLPIEVDCDQMEEYHDTMYRLWDWGYKNILPKDAFEKIKPYIK